MLRQLIPLLCLTVNFFTLDSALASEFSRPIRTNLYDDYNSLASQDVDPSEIEKVNLKALQEINSLQTESRPNRLKSINYEQAKTVLQSLNMNPITGPRGIFTYDPEMRIGFCFGRALFVHLELLRRGVSKDSIKKVFAVGPMKNRAGNWQFHVTTLVRGPQENWLAIDNYLNRIVTLEQWMDEMRTFSTDKKLRFYLTEPNKIGPSGWEYNVKPGGLFDPGYNGYFRDLFLYFRKNPISCENKFK